MKTDGDESPTEKNSNERFIVYVFDSFVKDKSRSRSDDVECAYANV